MKLNKTTVFIMIGVLVFFALPVGLISAQEANQPEPLLTESRSLDSAPTFGMNFHSVGNRNAFAPSNLNLADEANNHWVRYNGLLWSRIQPNNNTEWIWEYEGNPNQHLINAHNAGMEVILIIRSTPAWAQKMAGETCGPMREENISDFANFVEEVVKKYSQPPYNVMYYEIWNEPDAPRELVQGVDAVYGCWGNPTDEYFGGGYYAQVLEAIYPKVKVASNNQAQLVLGGMLVPCDPVQFPDWVHPGTNWPYCKQSRFIEGILKAGGAQYFDVINFHGFSFYQESFPSGIRMEKADPTYNGWWIARGGQIEGKLSYLNALMEQYPQYNVVNKPILLSEAGMPLWGSDNDNWNNWSDTRRERFEDIKADYLVYLFTRNIAIGIDVTTWYHFAGHGWFRSGILDQSGEPLPAYYAYKGVTEALSDASYIRRLPLGAHIEGFEFQLLNGSTLWALFPEDGREKIIHLNSDHQLFNQFYEAVGFSQDDFLFTRPIYIQFSGEAPVIGYPIYLPLIQR